MGRKRENKWNKKRKNMRDKPVLVKCPFCLSTRKTVALEKIRCFNCERPVKLKFNIVELDKKPVSLYRD